MTTFNLKRARQHLKRFDFETLFLEELGWDHYSTPLDVFVDGQKFTLQAVAEKRNVVALLCPLTDANARQAMRRKIERRVAQSFQEHIIIYADGDQRTQIWQWVRREPGKPLTSREHRYHTRQSGDSLLQKLRAIAFSLAEEEDLTLIDVTSRVRAAFNVDRATKKFYKLFKKERDAFEKFLQGVPAGDMKRWYVSVMLNRLMFIYFIQKKGFLDGDPDYLRHKLQQQDWQDRFYRDFLCPLFFQGFAQPEHPPTVKALLGQVPYLNGGIFQQHEVERLHGEAIEIPDKVFTRLFKFFDDYQWHLDDRPLRDDREINPDVLGYIFEKYINQKQMGAYYTKEDITEYISKNTIIPFLFDQARRQCRTAFEEEPSVWSLLQADPDRYIYPAVRQGVDLPLPPEIAAGLDDVSQREQWNTPTPDDYALPTEIWRETVARRQRYEETRAKLAAGQVRDINDLITYNLDIQQFAQDVIEQSEGPELLRAFWKSINNVSVLDPTCGSGAFLFAALNILEPLYEACLERMQGFVADLPPEAHPQKYRDFKEELVRVDQHPNERYFIYKSIMINNLYGVDIMDEAVEIAKLRLFLKLAAQVERNPRLPNQGIEPLPDIDFNIRAGNTLVGFATRDEVKKAMQSKQVGGGVSQGRMMFGEEEDALARIETLAGDIDRLFQRFRQQQTELGGEVTPETKAELRRRLAELENELNRALALQYGYDPNWQEPYEKWLASHQPFHWFIEFYGILKQGGFDVIIGNPPYVEYSKVKKIYQIRDYETLSCGNLYAMTFERSVNMLKNSGWTGMVVQQPIVSTQRMKTVRDILIQKSSIVFSSTYDDRPSKLFAGMHHARIAIIAAQKSKEKTHGKLFVTSYNKWYKEERVNLFNTVEYLKSNHHGDTALDVFPKFGSSVENKIISRLISLTSVLDNWISSQNSQHKIYYKITGVGHWFTITRRAPKFFRDGVEASSTRENIISFAERELRDCAFILLNSSLFYWFYQVRTNCRDFNPSDYRTFPIPVSFMHQNCGHLSQELQQALDTSSTFINMNHKKTGPIRLEQFRTREAKPIIDEIDRVLARHYGFTDEELDFIINYDIKYRMGDELFDDEEDEDED